MRIVFDCGMGGPDYPWGPWLVDQGLGGSEECVIYLAEALAKRGHDVSVINNCRGYQGIHGPVDYYLAGSVDTEQTLRDGGDLYVSWRNWNAVVHVYPAFGQHWLWCHDIPVHPHFPQEPTIFLQFVDRVVVLNNHHRRLYSAVPDEQVFVCPIGIRQDHFAGSEEAIRIPGRVVYCSHPHRGLDRLRAAWPTVKRLAPHATLQALWWQPEFFLPPDESLGILPMRSAGHAELAQELMQAEVFGYPSTFAPEISPATCIKAQAAGAVPVYVPAGGMVDVIQWGHAASHESFAVALANALNDQAWQESQRGPMIAWAKETYNWDKVAAMWEKRFEEDQRS
jgi:glycosyltransferase involved in cell wall biosynthesis